MGLLERLLHEERKRNSDGLLQRASLARAIANDSADEVLPEKKKPGRAAHSPNRSLTPKKE